MVTIDPNGSIGITIAGYNAANAGIIQHYEMTGRPATAWAIARGRCSIRTRS